MTQSSFYFKLIVYRYYILSGICILFGLAIAYSYLTLEGDNFPLKSELLEHSGYVEWVDKYKYGVKFGLKGSAIDYVYPSKANGKSIVERSLLDSERKIVSILYDNNDPTGPIYNDKLYYSVFEIFIGEKSIRTYEESKKAWIADDKLMPYISLFFIGGGLYVFRKGNKVRANA
jgi:hypothetical protein